MNGPRLPFTRLAVVIPVALAAGTASADPPPRAPVVVAAHRRGVKVVAITVAPWGGFRRYFNASRSAATLEVNRWIVQQRETGKVDAVIDAYGLLSCGDPTTLCRRYVAAQDDGLHFGPEGHTRLFDALFDQVFSGCT